MVYDSISCANRTNAQMMRVCDTISDIIPYDVSHEAGSDTIAYYRDGIEWIIYNEVLKMSCTDAMQGMSFLESVGCLSFWDTMHGK